MNIHLRGFKKHDGNKPMGDIIIHRHRHLSESDTRKLVNYGIEQGYETLADIPDEVADNVLDASIRDFDKYDDTPDFYTMEEIEQALNRIHNNYYVNWDVDDIMDKLKEEL